MDVLQGRMPATNVGHTERWLSIIGGGSLLAYGLARRDKAGFGLAVLAGSLLYRGATGHCGMYQAIGVNTAGHGHEKGTGMGTSVPYGLGIRVDHEIRINRSAEDLYKFWRHLENLPRFMDHLESVKEVDDKRSRWCAKGPAGWNVGWEAEIINDVQNELIGWRSLPGSDVDMGGSVRFENANEGSATDVKVSLQYNPPGGTLGKWAAQTFGEDPQKTVLEDLTRFKELMETGNLQKSSARTTYPARTPAPDKWDRDTVTDSSEESFPASDPPSWTPESL